MRELSYEEIEELPIVPMYDYVLVEIIEAPKKIGSIYIAETAEMAQEKRFARVVEVGTGRMMSNGTYFKLMLEKGDIIEINPTYTYDERKMAGKLYHLIREADCRGIVILPGQDEVVHQRIADHQNRYRI
jgi:co-chaperonin GroES (HSP10)